MKWQVAVKIAPINDNLEVTLCGANDKYTLLVFRA